jgi:hypothetical protein
MPLPDLFNAEKQIAFFPGWSPPEPETGYCRFAAALELNGVVEADFMLQGGTYKYHPDQHVTLELRIGKPGLKRKVPLARIDWRSLTGGHSNKRGPKVPFAGMRVGNCHVHGFEINWVDIEQRMRTDLSQAEPLPSEIQSFESLIEYAGKLFRISNIGVVEPPDWEYRLI